MVGDAPHLDEVWLVTLDPAQGRKSRKPALAWLSHLTKATATCGPSLSPP